MDRDPLIAYDAALCNYIVMQFQRLLPFNAQRPQVPGPPESRPPAASVGSGVRKPRTPPPLDWQERLDYPMWLSLQIGTGYPDLEKEFWPVVHTETDLRKLSYEELQLLEELAGEAPIRFRKEHFWESYPELHDRAVRVTAVLRKRLTKTDAERWAVHSARYGKLLCGVKLPVREGIVIVRKWLELLREFKEAIKAAASPNNSKNHRPKEQINKDQDQQFDNVPLIATDPSSREGSNLGATKLKGFIPMHKGKPIQSKGRALQMIIYFWDRHSATFDQVKEHCNEEVSDDTVHTWLNRAKNDLLKNGIPWHLKAGNRIVIKVDDN